MPSYYRCTIPPLDATTGFTYYDPAEAGYDEMRRFLEYLHREGLVGPHIATRETDADEILSNSKSGGGGAKHKPVSSPSANVGVEICVVDADEMLDSPAPMMEAFCRSVGIPYTEAMLNWDDESDHKHAKEAFEKWRGFHNDAIDSRGLTARSHVSYSISSFFVLVLLYALLYLTLPCPGSGLGWTRLGLFTIHARSAEKGREG